MASLALVAIVVGAIITSIAFGTYMYTQYQPNFILVNSGDRVQVGPVSYVVENLGEFSGDEETKPKSKFLQIQIVAENHGAEETTLSGGQFYIIGEDNKKFQPVFGNFSDTDLLLEKLEPGDSITRTTQFDIDYDDSKKYEIGILPTKIQASRDIGIICIQNCS